MLFFHPQPLHVLLLVQWNLRIKDMLGQGVLSFIYREVFYIQRLKCIGIIGIGTSRFVLYREVFFIRSVIYRRFHCCCDNFHLSAPTDKNTFNAMHGAPMPGGCKQHVPIQMFFPL